MKYIETDIPKRLDGLPWSSFHTKFLLALGITWVLDAFEVVIVGNVLRNMMQELNLSGVQASLVVSGFLLGAILGSFIFGFLADRFGRKKIFIITLLLYSLGTFLTGFAWDFWSVFILRIVAGAGIGGEFAAIHSAIDEFIPARHRGKVDGFIVASWNLGSILASFTAILLFKYLPQEYVWRVAFFLGGFIALLVAVVRRHVPESPRWLLSKGKVEEAKSIVEKLEKEAGVRVQRKTVKVPVPEGGLLEGVKFILKKYPWRFLFSASLSFTILTTYYTTVSLIPVSLSSLKGIPAENIPEIFLIGSFMGLIGGIVVAILGDVLGRKITGTLIAFLSLITAPLMLIFDNLYISFGIYSLFAFSFASVAYVSATEIYPSFIRATAIGMISIVGRISGTLIPPLIVGLSEINHIYGIAGLSLLWFAGFLSFVLWSVFGIEAKRKSIEEIT